LVLRDKVVGVFVRFCAPLHAQQVQKRSLVRAYLSTYEYFCRDINYVNRPRQHFDR
jgi:hypothetical protein